MMANTKFMETVVSLLAKEHCVVIPGFGALIGRQSDASLNYLSKEVKPSHTTVVFNKQITEDDGLLTNEIRTALNIQYKQAYEIIQTEIEHLKSVLENKKMASFAPLGNFFLNSQREIFFIGSSHLNLDSHYFGLKPIRWVVNQPESKSPKLNTTYQAFEIQPETKVEPEIIEASEAIVVEISSEEQSIHQEKRRRAPFWNVAANIAFASLALGVLYLNSISWKSMLKNENASQASSVMAPKANAVNPSETNPLTAEQKDSVETAQTQLVVVGGQVIPIKKKAGGETDSLLSETDFKTQLVDKKGKYFVVAGSYITEDAAKIECLQWRKLHRNAAYFHIHNSSLIRVVLDRFESGKKASAFAVSIKTLPSNTISIQELSLVK